MSKPEIWKWILSFEELGFELGFRIPNIWQILHHISRGFLRRTFIYEECSKYILWAIAKSSSHPADIWHDKWLKICPPLCNADDDMENKCDINMLSNCWNVVIKLIAKSTILLYFAFVVRYILVLNQCHKYHRVVKWSLVNSLGINVKKLKI